MLGAIIGDISGSVYEFSDKKPFLNELIDSKCFFTDDTVLTLAIADSLISMKKENNFLHSEKIYKSFLKQYGTRYPDAGYGQDFSSWLISKYPKPYNSYGNGSAMRVSSIGYAFTSFEETLSEAKHSAKITHNHKDGIKGAKAIAGSIFLARNGESKEKIKNYIQNKIGYNLSFNLDDLHNNYTFHIKCSESVPQAIYSFLISEDFEDSIRKAIYIGGDSDTLACISGSIAEAFYQKIPSHLIQKAKDKLDSHQKQVIRDFYQLFINFKERTASNTL